MDGRNSKPMNSTTISESEIMKISEDLAKLKDMMTVMYNTSNSQEKKICQESKTIKRIKTEGKALIKSVELNNLFKNEWKTLTMKHQSSYFNLKWLDKNNGALKKWLVYLYNENEPSESKFQCQICNQYVKKTPVSSHVQSALAHDEGYINKNKVKMYEALCDHDTKNKIHLAAMQDKKNGIQESLDEFVSVYKTEVEKCETETRSNLIITENMFRTVYAETLLNIPLDSHKDIVMLQELNGINMGKHHYERTSATCIMSFISEQMAKRLVSMLQTTPYPIALIVDTSTDSSNNNYLIVYFKTIEYHKPTVYFYRILGVKSEKAIDLKKLIFDAFEEDGILGIMKERLIGFTSDGASVMIGKHNGLGTLISQEVTNKLFITHCMAHKLELAIGHAFDKIQKFRKNFEGLVNGIYSFYNNKAVKRKSSLKETATALNEVFYELNYVYSVRWVSSELHALDRLNKSYSLILMNLENIQADNDFDALTRSTALGYIKN